MNEGAFGMQGEFEGSSFEYVLMFTFDFSQTLHIDNLAYHLLHINM